MSLLYLELIPISVRTDFDIKVREIASWLGVNPNWLMQTFWAESKMKATAANRGSDGHLVAAGLLQFTQASGIVSSKIVSSLDAILKMGPVQQLELVRWYFASRRGMLKSYYDVYAHTFFPAAIGRPDNWVFQTKTLSAATIAKQNPAISKGKSQITVADFKNYVFNVVPKLNQDSVFGRAITTIETIVTNNPGSAGAAATAIIAAVLFFSTTGTTTIKASYPNHSTITYQL